MTGSDRRIWKVSACSYVPSARILTLHVALLWPGLNWICFWDFPLKSSSLTAVPSWVAIPGEQKMGWENKAGNGEVAARKGDRQKRETDEKQMRYSHSLRFRERWENKHCVYFSSLITYTASGMCEMNLWLVRLNKPIPPYWDGLASTAGSHDACMCVHAFPLIPSVIALSYDPVYNNPSNIHAHHFTFLKAEELSATTGSHIKPTSRKPRSDKPHKNVLQ